MLSLTLVFRHALPHSNGASASSNISEPKTNLQRLYEATPEVVMPAPLERSNHPDCKFWDRHAWEEWKVIRRETVTSNNRVRGQGINSSFIEGPDGTRVDFPRQQQILKEARETLCLMKDFNISLKSHTKMTTLHLDYFRARLESKFYELRLCQDHWKADKIWQENYSSWQNSRQEQQQQQKESRQPAPGPREDDDELRPPEPPLNQVSIFTAVFTF